VRRGWLWFNSLSLILLGFFLLYLTLQSIFGWQVRNEELMQAGLAADSYGHYLTTGHFGEAVFENWESEFLQMGSYVLLTAYVVQRGSPESKPVDVKTPKARGSWLYQNSLSIALLGVFVLSFVAHLFTGTSAYNEEQALQSGKPPVSVWTFLGTPDFWFQSMQNWQSEFLAVGALVVLSIFLRQRGSPQSKPMEAPHLPEED
jgi:hypothetical protein